MNANNRINKVSSTSDNQSLLNAINKFVQAVETMDDTVMIPCKLRDIPIEGLPQEIEENNNSKAIVPANALNGDLYHFYAMLQAIRSEIAAGPKSEEEVNDNDEISTAEIDPIQEQARATASRFRHHLRGLFGVLHQMTETAKLLSSRYEKEVSSAQSGIASVSSFNM